MSDIKFSLPGSEAVTLTGQAIDKLINAGDGDAALLYLYILKTHGQGTTEEAAKALDKGKGWIASAMAVLSRLGLVQLNDASKANIKADDLPNEPRRYTEDEVKGEILAGTDFSIVVDETQRRLGTILSPHDLMRLYGIYDNLRLPPEVIMLLITHCIKECSNTGDGRSPNVRYIEKAAYTWEREGIFSLDKAEEYLKALENKKSLRGEIKRIVQIRDREFAPTEKRYVDGWIDMGFKSDAIAIAYDRAVMKAKGSPLPYMDGIMKNWHNRGLHSAEDISENDSGKRTNTSGTYSRPGDKKHGDPSREEIDRMQRLLNKIKDEQE